MNIPRQTVKWIVKRKREMNLDLEQRKVVRKFSENRRNFEESTMAHTRMKISKKADDISQYVVAFAIIMPHIIYTQ